MRAKTSTAASRLHVALNVEDLERSTRFYREIFALEPDKVREGYARFTLEDPPLVLALNAGETVRGGNRLAHLGVRLRSAAELDAVRERIAHAGHLRKEEKGITCCHSVQDKVWAVDPDGVHWEFYELIDDRPGSAAIGPAPGASGCCS